MLSYLTMSIPPSEILRPPICSLVSTTTLISRDI